MRPQQQAKHTRPPHGGLGSLERQLLDALAAAEKPAVSADDVLELMPISRSHATRILTRLAAKGWLVRLRRGIYSIVPLGSPSPQASVEDAWSLAMVLFSPGYISGWTAAEHWDLTEQVFNAIAVVTAKPQRQREQAIAGIRFVCRTVDERRLFGTTRIWTGGKPVVVADPHRLIIDILAAPELGGGGRQAVDIVRAYWASKHADAGKLIEYAERYGKGVVFKRLGFLAETLASPSSEWLERCRQQMSAGVSLLDPKGPNRGKIISRWRIRINLAVEAP